MEKQTDVATSSVPSGRDRTPLDLLVVACLLFAVSLLCMAFGLLLVSGVARPLTPFPQFYGLAPIRSGRIYSIFMFCAGAGHLFCAWGLMRHMKLAWWFSLVFYFYLLTEWLFLLLMDSGGAISVGMYVAVILWLWFRRDLFN